MTEAIVASGRESWLLRSLTSMPFNRFEADRITKRIRYHDVWGTTELLNDENFMVMFSLVDHQNEVLRQPGPFTPVLE